MLDKIKEKHEQIFIKEFETDFGKDFNVKVDWGFPNLVLTISSNETKEVVVYKFFINGVEKTFHLETLGYVVDEEEVKVPKSVVIDGKVLSYIVSKALKIYEETFEDKSEKSDETE